MLGSPVGPFVGSSWRRQTTLHVEMFNMSDQVALNGRSTSDKHMCDQNTCKPFLNCAQAPLVPKPPVFESRCVRERSRKCASLTITHYDQNTYQLYTSNTTTILHGQKQSWETIQIRCDQLTEPHGSCQILRCWYKSQLPCSPVSEKTEE